MRVLPVGCACVGVDGGGGGRSRVYVLGESCACVCVCFRGTCLERGEIRCIEGGRESSVCVCVYRCVDG